MKHENDFWNISNLKLLMPYGEYCRYEMVTLVYGMKH